LSEVRNAISDPRFRWVRAFVMRLSESNPTGGHGFRTISRGIQVQLCTNPEAMPIDDPTKQWDEVQSPFVPVARLTVDPQSAWSASRSEAVDDGMSFSPWHGV
jgi:hypothetical protein